MRNNGARSATDTPMSGPASGVLRQWLSAERLSDTLFIALLTLIEILPIQAALLTYTAAGSTSLSETFGPLWLIGATVLLFALARWRLAPHGAAWMALAALLIGASAVGLFVALSPTGYGHTPGGLFSGRWLTQLQQDATLDTPRFNRLFGIAPFVAYVGWRGMALVGGSLPKIETILRRFSFSLTVVIIACIGAVAAPITLQTPLQSALLPLLALDVFAGLAAAALARRGAGRDSASGDAPTNADALRWLLTAFGAAALVIVVALIIGLLFNPLPARTLLGALSPLGAALNAALAWLTTGLAYLLWIAFVKTLGAWLFRQSTFYMPPPQRGPLPASRAPAHSVLAPAPQALVIAVEALIGSVILFLIVFVVYLAVRSILRSLQASQEPEQDEEREALDALGLLRRQWHDALAALRSGRGAPDADPLTHGSARWLYRETLRAGAAAGLARKESETADEFSKRLTAALRETSAGDEVSMAALTQAYDEARYGEGATNASPEAAAEARQVASALARLRAER